MDTLKLRRAAEELRQESYEQGNPLRYRIISGSMRPLIFPGDDVMVRRTAPSEITVGDIIAWKRTGSPSPYPVAHRVIAHAFKNGRRFFRTKGDFNIRPDRPLIAEDDILGRVVAVSKARPAVEIPLERGWGKLLGLAAFAIALPVAPAWSLMRRAAAICAALPAAVLPERACRFDGRRQLIRYHAGVSPERWSEKNRRMERILKAATETAAVGDIQPGGGFSEEAMILLRRGLRVQSIPIPAAGRDPRFRNAFDWLILAGVLDIFPAGKPRRMLLEAAYDYLKPGGRLALSAVTVRRGRMRQSLVDAKRRFYGSLPGIPYGGPLAGDLVRGGCFLRRSVTRDEAAAMTAGIGFLPGEINDDNGILTMVAMK